MGLQRSSPRRGDVHGDSPPRPPPRILRRANLPFNPPRDFPPILPHSCRLCPSAEHPLRSIQTQAAPTLPRPSPPFKTSPPRLQHPVTDHWHAIQLQPLSPVAAQLHRRRGNECHTPSFGRCVSACPTSYPTYGVQDPTKILRSYRDVVQSGVRSMSKTPPAAVPIGKGKVRFNFHPAVALFHRDAPPSQISVFGQPNSKLPQAQEAAQKTTALGVGQSGQQAPATVFNPPSPCCPSTQLAQQQSKRHDNQEDQQWQIVKPRYWWRKGRSIHSSRTGHQTGREYFTPSVPV